jgi:serine/threonine-protein kinase
MVTRLVSGSKLAGYRIEEQVGAGGMAAVFAAHDERLGRRVALKVLAPSLAADDGFRQRFIRESRAAVMADDPHILPVYEAGEAGGVLFIAMRFVSGGDLRSLVRQEGPLAPARAMAFICPVASALDAAHAAGLVHRDVKPGNVLVDAHPGRPEHVYLSDFGLSKDALSSLELTGPGQFLGTPNYAAPEQISGQAVDGRADQYALACVAFELLAGAAPFAREQHLAVMWAQLTAPPPSVADLRPDLALGVDSVLARALAKAPEDRYGSCQDFASALCDALGLPRHDSAVVSPDHERAFAELNPPRTTSAPRTDVGPRQSTISRSADARRGRRARPAWRHYLRAGLAGAAAILVAAGAILVATLHHPEETGTGETGTHDNSISVRLIGAVVANADFYASTPVAFSPDGKTVAYANANGNAVLILNVATRTPAATLPLPKKLLVTSLAFSSDGRTLAIGDSDQEVWLWDTATGAHTVLSAPAYPGAEGMSNVLVAFSRDGHMLAAADGGAVYLWNPASHARVNSVRVPYGLNVPDIGSIALSLDGKTLAAAGSPGFFRLWNLTDHARATTLPPIPGEFPGAGDRVALSPDDKVLATAIGTGSGLTYLWDVASHARVATFTDPGRNSVADAVAFSPDGKILASAASDGSISLWDVASHARLATFTDPGRNSAADAVAFSPDGETLATGDTDRHIYLWKIAGSLL